MRALNLKEKTYWRIIAAITSGFFIAVLFWSIASTLSREVKLSTTSTKYRLSSSSSYSVVLKNGQETVSSEYKASQIDKIKIAFDYDISFTDFFNIDSTNYIKAIVKSKDEILKEETLALNNEKKSQEGTSHFNIKEQIEIDYAYFNSFVQDKEGEYNLEILFSINNNLEVLSDDSSLIEKTSSSVIIPLNVEEVKIADVPTRYMDKELNSNLSELVEVNYPLIIISLLLIIALLPLFLKSYLEVYRLTNFGSYDRRLNKINKKYSKLIINSEKKPLINSDQRIDVKSFEDLLSISKDLAVPITAYSDNSKNEVIYTVIGLKMTYVYTLRVENW